MTILPLIYAALTAFFILVPTDSAVASAKVSRVTYELTQFLPLLVVVLFTVAFFIWGHVQTRGKEIVVELAGEQPLGEVSPGPGISATD